jgi:hypothetical protein
VSGPDRFSAKANLNWQLRNSGKILYARDTRAVSQTLQVNGDTGINAAADGLNRLLPLIMKISPPKIG